MLRKIALGLFAASAAVATVIAVAADTRSPKADDPPAKSDPIVQNNGNGNGKNLKPTTNIPIKQVVLFNSGVGYFQRSGNIDGEGRVELQFSAGDINDLIKSLVVSDPKGKIMPLRYDSQEPVEKTLKSFAIDLSGSPTLSNILQQARGQKLEVTLQTTHPSVNGQPATMSGVVLGLETSQRPSSTGAPGATPMEMLNLMCTEGIRSIPLAAVQKVRFLDTRIENELKRALEVVAVGHDGFKKTVNLDFKGTGSREVKVGYVAENPIWKTSYRLVEEGGKWRLKAWANVENTSDEDWNDVKLTLVSARPISFQMDLYPPLFIPRPTVEPSLFASLRPPTYQGPMANIINVPGFGNLGGAGAFNNTINNNDLQQQIGQRGGNFGMGQGTGMGMGQGINPSNRAGNNPNWAQLDNNNGRLNFEQYKARQEGGQKEQKEIDKLNTAKNLGSVLVGLDDDAINRARVADELGQTAKYNIDQKVSLPRQQSVMLPILDEEVDGKRVSIYNTRVHPKHPLQGLKIKNKSKQALMSGPVTVYDGEQTYSGDARLNDMQPNEERYVGFAIDTGVEIKPFDRVNPGPELTARVENGRLTVQYKLRSTRAYAIVNRAPEARTVVIEQPVRTGWNLVLPEKPAERTADLYRFEVEVKAGETVKYEVAEELPRIDPFEQVKQADFNGFATSLGLDVSTDSRREPEDDFSVRIEGDQLRVIHRDRRTTTYFVHNRAEEERTIWLEHGIHNDKEMLSPKPEKDEDKRIRFKLVLKPNEKVSKTVSEQLKVARFENFAKRDADFVNPRGWTGESPRSRFITELGFEVWEKRTKNAPDYVSAKFNLKELVTTERDSENTTYFIRNLTNKDRTISIEHSTKEGWKNIGDVKPIEGTRGRYKYEVKVGKDQIQNQVIREELDVARNTNLDEITAEKVEMLRNTKTISNEVKVGLGKILTQRGELKVTQAKLTELRDEIKTITTEQDRLRTNLNGLPQTSDLYKRYIKKLDEQETQLEKVQGDLTKQLEVEKKQKTAYETLKVQLANGQ